MTTTASHGSPLRLTRSFSLAKRTDTPNEDRWLQSDNLDAVALSDGASVSYNSGHWAEVLVRRFVTECRADYAWLGDAISEYSRSYDRDEMTWVQQAAYDRGSFAALTGILLANDGRTIRAFVSGDALLVITDGAELKVSLPYTDPQQFDQSPQMLCTERLQNGFVDDDWFARCWHSLDLGGYSEPRVLLMTDALGRWLLNGLNEARVETLLAIRTPDEFDALVQSEREAGRLHRDDTTLLVVEECRDVPSDR